MNIQWYPGHMTKAKRQMLENIKLIDLLVELLDARAPKSSKNPDIDEIGRNKARLLLLNKADMADPGLNAVWKKHFEDEGCFALLMDARANKNVKRIREIMIRACSEKIERDRKKGIRNRPIRAMVVGVPNVGKSTLINSMAGRASAKTGNRPAVTKGEQWIRLSKEIELLDTPGILWPKLDGDDTGRHLALIGSVRDEILNKEELALYLYELLRRKYPGVIEKRYRISETADEPEKKRILEEIAVRRGCIAKGGERDLERAAVLFLDDFRAGRLGRISLERPGCV